MHESFQPFIPLHAVLQETTRHYSLIITHNTCVLFGTFATTATFGILTRLIFAFCLFFPRFLSFVC